MSSKQQNANKLILLIPEDPTKVIQLLKTAYQNENQPAWLAQIHGRLRDFNKMSRSGLLSGTEKIRIQNEIRMDLLELIQQHSSELEKFTLFPHDNSPDKQEKDAKSDTEAGEKPPKTIIQTINGNIGVQNNNFE